ncbi:MAG: tape measure protein [Candidatus Poseidoniales archaeon]
MSTALKGAGIALAAVFATRVVKSVIETTARFEDLNDALASVTGSAQAGAQAFDFVSEFATKTQFGVEDLTTTFIKLKASGIEPTEDLLTLFTDTAAVTTDQLGSLQAITDLFARTTSGGLGLEELNRLADRGVPVFRILEEQLGLTRLEISNVGKTAEGSKKILNALSTGLRQDFGGATAKVVDNLSTQFSNLNIALKNSANEFGQGLSPALKDVIADITTFVEDNEELIAALGRLGGTVLKGVVNLFIAFAKALGSIVVGGEKLIEFLSDGERKMDDFHDSLVGPDDELLAIDQAIRDITNIPIKPIGDMGEMFDEVGDSVAELAEKTVEYTDALGDYNEEGKTVTEVLKAQADEAARVNRETGMMAGRFVKVTKAKKEAKKETTAYEKALGDLLAQYEPTVVITETLIGSMTAFAKTTESALTDVIMGTKTLQAALGEIGRAILRELIGGIIRLVVVGPILERIAKIFNVDMVSGVMRQVEAQKQLNSQLKRTIALQLLLRLLGGAADGGAVGYGNSKGRANGGAIGYRGARAMGGNVGTGGAYLVGERGPELFVPNTAGTVVSNESMGGRVGETTINFNINAVDAASFDELLISRKNLIVGTIQQAFRQQGRRLA